MAENQQQAPITDNDEVVIVDQYDAEGLKKNLVTSLEQKKHWRSKAIDPATGKTYKELFEAMKAAADKPQETTPTLPKKEETHNAPSNNLDWIDSFDAIRDLKSDELTEMRATSRELGVDPLKYIKSKAGAAHLKDIRANRKADESTPGPSNRVPTFNGKPINKILTDDKASPEEKQAAFEAKMKRRGLNQNQ